jgi:hypothetical protein
MASALIALANATASFTVPTTGTTTDPTTGNVVANTETITVSLYLRSFGALELVRGLPGVEVKDDTFEGYAVDPSVLDARIRPGTVGTVSIGGQPAQRCEVLVSRHPYGTTGLVGTTIQQVLGDKIRLARFAQR